MASEFTIEDHTVLVHVSKYSRYFEWKQDAGTATIRPGELVSCVPALQDTIEHPPVENEAYPTLFAYENIYWGKGVDDEYYPGERVMVRSLRQGDIIMAWAPSSLTNLAFGAPMGAFTNGTLIKHVAPGISSIIGYSLEQITAPGGVDWRFPLLVA